MIMLFQVFEDIGLVYLQTPTTEDSLRFWVNPSRQFAADG